MNLEHLKKLEDNAPGLLPLDMAIHSQVRFYKAALTALPSLIERLESAEAALREIEKDSDGYGFTDDAVYSLGQRARAHFNKYGEEK